MDRLVRQSHLQRSMLQEPMIFELGFVGLTESHRFTMPFCCVAPKTSASPMDDLRNRWDAARVPPTTELNASSQRVLVVGRRLSPVVFASLLLRRLYWAP
jgi:hypothetical protein